MPPFERVCIVGVGLLGASLGLALKKRKLAHQVVGVGHRQSSLDVALDRQAIDEAFLDTATGAKGASLVVVATPAALVTQQMDAVRETAPDAIVTDVASTKADICRHAEATWPTPRRFVGSHPMAGSEKFGAEHGTPDFYEGTVCLVEKAASLNADARDAIVSLWSSVGAEVVDVDPAVHDTMLASTSHIPHVMASAIASLTGRRGDVHKLVGNGFRDTTRIADGRPEVWRDICLTNRDAILAGMEELKDLIENGFMEALRDGDGDKLERFFAEGRTSRRRALGLKGNE